MKDTYNSLDADMQAEVVDSILPHLELLSRQGKADWIAQARIKMTMVPTMGFFLVVPIISCPALMKQLAKPDLEQLLDEHAAGVQWVYCFAQNSSKSE